MSSLNEISRHIRSVDVTRQMSNAMFLLSSARTKKVMAHIRHNKTYYHLARQVMKDILLSTQNDFTVQTAGESSSYLTPSDKAAYSSKESHNLVLGSQEEVEKSAAASGAKTLYVVVASDKGLCGSYNHNILNATWEHMQKKPPAMICTAGFTATKFFIKKGIIPDVEFLGMVQDPKLSFARTICDSVLRAYDESDINEVRICYTYFKNSVHQYPVIERLLPLNLEDFEDEEFQMTPNKHVIYEPSASEIFKHIIPQYLTGLIHQALCMSYTSENSARMTAMQNSTKNADEMLVKLKMQYNRKRQLKITQDITEISGSSRGRKY